jgi:hypothetical protein
MVLQHAKRIVAVGPGDAIEGPALGEKCWKRGITIAGGIYAQSGQNRIMEGLPTADNSPAPYFFASGAGAAGRSEF